jgi:hypothetical protein
MKYSYLPVHKTKAIIELIPDSEQDKTLLRTLDVKNPDHEMTLFHHFQKGLQSRHPSAVLLGIDEMIDAPKKALVSFEIVIGY